MGAKTDQVKGLVQETVGRLSHNAKLRRRGQAGKVAGKLREVVEDGKGKLEAAVHTVKGRSRRG